MAATCGNHCADGGDPRCIPGAVSETNLLRHLYLDTSLQGTLFLGVFLADPKQCLFELFSGERRIAG